MLGLGTGINKLSAAEAASIAARNAGSYLLDDYSGVAAAYSLRQLSSTYSGSSVKVRRASDNVEADIGFASGELDTTALASHCGASDGFVSVWYDQANSNNATQATAANQPKIYDGTTGVVTENGKPAVEFAGGTVELQSSSVVNGATQAVAVVRTDAVAFGYLYGATSDFAFRIHATGWRPASSTNTSDFYNGGSLYIDGSEVTVTQSSTSQRLAFANAASGGYAQDLEFVGGTYPSRHLDGKLQELIMYTSDQSSNRTNIEDNINTFYNIY